MRSAVDCKSLLLSRVSVLALRVPKEDVLYVVTLDTTLFHSERTAALRAQ